MTEQATYDLDRRDQDAGLLDIPAAAARLGVTQRWVRRAVAERRISFVKVGRNVRFEPEAISLMVPLDRTPGVRGSSVQDLGGLTRDQPVTRLGLAL